MSFLTDLNTGCSAYTAFTYNGSSIKLPYYLGGKKTPDQIRTAIANWGGSSKTTTEIQTYVSNNRSTFGIDCSGLVYYALNEASSGAVRTYFESKLNNAVGKLTYAFGISASNLTNTHMVQKSQLPKISNLDALSLCMTIQLAVIMSLSSIL